MNHVMLDLETLDTRESAVVLSIGAVAFDPHAEEPLGERFYVELTDDLDKQRAVGRTTSPATAAWWAQQSDAARMIFAPSTSNCRVLTLAGLSEFKHFLGRNGGRQSQIWGNGADFDNVILGSLYEAFAMDRPWSYSKNRCYRTMKSLDFSPPRADRQGTHHNALDDAVTQARHLCAIMKALPSSAPGT